MTTFTTGVRVAILAPSYPDATGIVTDPCNECTYLTVTVLVDARPYVTAHETYFDPTDELELIDGQQDAIADVGVAGPAVPA